MRYIEIRRHSIRARPDAHLSRAGVALAQRVGQGIGPFARVVTSTLPRAIETATAMGFSVAEQVKAFNSPGDAVDLELGWPAGFGELAQNMKQSRVATRLGRKLVTLLRQIVTTLPEGGAALVVSHGGIVEAAAIVCLPDADYATWGPSCDYCEGVRLAFDGQKFVGAELLRVARGGDALPVNYV